MSDEIKLAKNMSEEERQAFLRAHKLRLAEIERAPPPPETSTPKMAKNMTEIERAEWLAEHKRRFRS